LAPAQGDGSIVFVGALTASTFTTRTGATPIDVPGTTGLFGLYPFDPATQTQSTTLASGHWGTLGVEINHGWMSYAKWQWTKHGSEPSWV
jgi:hypothetical protein